MSPRELERRAKHKLGVRRHVEEVSGNVSATYRYYGISRRCYCTWRRRFDEGFDGLKDRLCVPHHQPTRTDPQIIKKILWLRQQHHFGSQKISMYLHCYHDLAISSSGIWSEDRDPEDPELRSSPRRSGRSDTLRTPPAEGTRPAVKAPNQLHS